MAASGRRCPTGGSARSGWFKATASSGCASCVEIRFEEDRTAIRDSKYLRDPGNDPAAEPQIRIPIEDWAAFVAQIEDEASRPAVPGLVVEAAADAGEILFRAPDCVLRYTPSEWSAFVTGALAGEFTPVLASL